MRERRQGGRRHAERAALGAEEARDAAVQQRALLEEVRATMAAYEQAQAKPAKSGGAGPGKGDT